MEYPHGHHHHHSSTGDDGRSGRNPPPGSTHPPPFAGEGFYQPPPSYPPPPQNYSGYPPHPAQPVGHVSHEAAPTRPSYYPHLPSFTHHQTSAVVPAELVGKPTFKVYCKANPNFALTIRDEKVVLAYANPTDPHQHWHKDEKYSTRVKDEEGSPCFALVNQATGLAVKHSVGASHPVLVIPYTSDRLDESVMWAMSKDFGDGYRTIRMVNNIRLNMDVFHGDKKSGGVHDGMTIVLWQWNKGITSCGKSLLTASNVILPDSDISGRLSAGRSDGTLYSLTWEMDFTVYPIRLFVRRFMCYSFNVV